MVTFGIKLRTMRALRGLSQPQLSQLVDIHPSNLSEYEHDLTRPRQKSLEKLEAALTVRFNDPAVEAAFVVLDSNEARAEEVRLALALLEKGKNGR